MPIKITAQALSIFAMLTAALAFQCKSNKNFCIWQAVSSSAFAASFIILGAYTGALSNIVNIFRGTLFGLAPRKYRKAYLVFLELAYIGVAFFTYDGIFSLIILAAQVVGTASIFFDRGKVIRIIQFFWISPIWLAYSIYFFSLGGILCEVFTLVSIIISVIRYGFDGFEK